MNRHRALLVALLQTVKILLQHRLIGGIGIVHAGPILTADVIALTIFTVRINDGEENAENVRQRDLLRIIRYLDRFGRAGCIRAYIFIARRRLLAVGVADFRRDHSGQP